MKLDIMTIDENVANGTDEIMCDAIEFLNKVLTADEVTAISVAQQMDSPVDILEGLYRYIQRIKYMGSKGVVENLTCLLACEDDATVRDTLRQWKEAEEMMWEVISSEEK